MQMPPADGRIGICSARDYATKYLLRSVGMAQEVTSLQSLSAWQRMFRHPSLRPLQGHLAMHAEMWHFATEKVVESEEELTRALSPSEETISRLATTPGVALITAVTFMAVMATPERFPPPRAGPFRQLHRTGAVRLGTGDGRCHGPMTRRGSGKLRAMLREAGPPRGAGAARANPVLAEDFCQTRVQQGHGGALAGFPVIRSCDLLIARLGPGTVRLTRVVEFTSAFGAFGTVRAL